MLIVTLKKLISKKWMFLCLCLGSMLLIAAMLSLPLYENAAFDRMLRDEFQTQLEKTGKWPAQLYIKAVSQQRTGASVIREWEAFLDNLDEELHVTPKENVQFYRTVVRQVNSARDDSRAHYKVRISMLTDLEEHSTMLNGEWFSEDGLSEDGAIEVAITQECMINNDFVVGETLSCSTYRDENGDKVRLKIVGIIEPNEGEYFWEIGTNELGNVCFMQEELFREWFMGADADEYTINANYCYLFEYKDLSATRVDEMLLTAQDERYSGSDFQPILESFAKKRARIEATLTILQVPMIVLLVAFLVMISGQMYEVERNEIAVIKSRGSSRVQIFGLYFYQIVVVTCVSTIFGIPLGVLFARMLGSASGFLEFGVKRQLGIAVSGEVFLYFFVAILIIVTVMALPAIKHSKVSIVNLKQKKGARKKSLWERFFLDFLCLGVGIYGYYNFKRTEELLIIDVLAQKPMDPLLYISSSLFVVGLGLLFLRFLPLFAKLIYLIGQKLWRPATYASFLEIMRSGRKQQFVMLLLILTIGLGTFHATVAQTILNNAVANTEYLTGTDMIVKEHWRDNADAAYVDASEGNGEVPMHFYDMDYTKYLTLDGIKSYTKVYYDDLSEDSERMRCYVQKASGQTFDVNMMLVHSKDFGEKTWIDRKYLEQHYYDYLNLLADNPDGFLVSRNFAKEYDLQVGNRITMGYEVLMIVIDGTTPIYHSFDWSGPIVGIIDYWPGYTPVSTYLDESGEVVEEQTPLVVGNYQAFETVFGRTVQPYEVWIELEDDVDEATISQWMKDADVRVAKYVNQKTEVENTITEPLMQGTNGILTMEFIVMILLCGVGYLVYWIMSIRDREMMFGVLRAFGMHKGELLKMLCLEQFFSGVLTAIVAVGIGQLTSELFTPIMQTAYSAAQQVLPMELSVDMSDMLRLYSSIVTVMVICLGVLAGFVFKLNMTKALKLGED